MSEKEGHEIRQRAFMINLQKLCGMRSDKEFADFLGMKYVTVYQYMTGRRFPTLGAAAQIADKCGVSIDWLVGHNVEDLEQQNLLNGDVFTVC